MAVVQVYYRLIFLPALDLDVFELHCAERFDEGLCEARVGEQGDVVVDCSAADLVAVGEFALRVVLGHVDDEVEGVCGNHVHDLVVAFFVGP